MAFYEKEGSIEISITAFSFKGNGLDIGMAIINTVFAFITQGIDELKKAGHLSIKGAGFTKWIFTLESLAITFTYNQGTQDWAKGVAAVVFDTTVMGVTRAIIGIIGVFIGMSWWFAIIVAAFIAFLAVIFSNTQMGKNTINTLAEIIKTNVKKARRFFSQKAHEYFSFFTRDVDFWKNVCEDIMCKDFSEETLHDLLVYCEYYKANGLTFRRYCSNLFDSSYTPEDICDSSGRINTGYKAMIEEDFWRSVAFNKQKHTLAYNASKPKLS